MRGLLSSTFASPFTSSLGITCATTLVVPLAVVAAAPAMAGGPAPRAVAAETQDAGSTQSLPLAPLAGRRAAGAAPDRAERGLVRQHVRPFSLVGVVWDDPDAEFHGRVQVRTRAAATGGWSDWKDLETHTSEHGADPGTAEKAARGGTAPLWVGASDGVEVRTGPEADAHAEGGALPALPSGLRAELVDPGDGSAAAPVGRAGAPARSGGLPGAPAGRGPEVLPALSRAETRREAVALRAVTPDPDATPEQEAPAPAAGDVVDEPLAAPYIGPRPAIVTRKGWKANEGLREQGFVYTSKVKVAFVHHTATGNGYTCAQAPSVIRSIYRYHVGSMGWRDIGYNFLVDKCGKIYEGRAGGVARPVMGAHTLGFNSNSMGVAVIGSFGYTKPSAKAVRGIARLTAWKLGLHGMNPKGKTYLTSGGGNRYRKGKNVRLNTISGHRDGFATSCPGGRLYSKLGTARTTSARYQGR
ncbi:peptidoglycan recognition protein family protein [Streptomyces fragilis]|uniref:peptidoglycan recognition protein family protein n=1 Tax=Streptomyces fragilis TaxID=67301 RepID=UPI001FE7D8EB|nr:N-acetylmuramoyl-L-alanine amidase [Streptomyces fragilis]